jgi:hypothetical protein
LGELAFPPFALFDQQEHNMLTKIQNIFKFILDQVYASIEMPKRNDVELTKSSWAKPIKSYADVPDVYKDFFGPFLANGREFPYTILTPSYEKFIHKTSEKLICDGGCEIIVLEKSENTFETQCYPVGGISYVEFRTALLASSFKICGMTNQGGYTSSTLKFNTVTDYLFAPILKRVRPAPVNSKILVQNTEKKKFDCLADVNFKFMNLARHSLLEGEKVIQFILQPEIQEKLLTFLNKTYYRTISATHMSILTDRELIVIREDTTQRKDDRYGGFWDYIPLRKIKSLSMSERNNSLLALIVQLPENTEFEILFQDTAREELNQLLGRFKELTTG